MPASKYEEIYRSIKAEIENSTYTRGDFLPSENEYVQRFGCSRNTVRRALAMLSQEGYVLARHGAGVQVIYQKNPDSLNLFSVGGIESLAEAASRNAKKVRTKILVFETVVCDEELSLKTGFDTGENLFHIERLRVIDGEPLILDINYFLVSEMPDLTKEIASHSIYDYLEHDLGMTITNSRRRVTAEPSTKRDEKYLNLGHQHFVLAVAGQVFNTKGIMFEYTESRHRPDRVCFIQSAVRQKI